MVRVSWCMYSRFSLVRSGPFTAFFWLSRRIFQNVVYLKGPGGFAVRCADSKRADCTTSKTAYCTKDADSNVANRNHPYPRRTSRALVPFLDEIKDMTAGTGLEQWLQAKQGVGSALYSELSRLITLGIEQGWAADTEIAGPRYRRSRLIAPCAETFFFSGTSVLMDSTGNPQNNPEGSFRGDYHLHPYGEINMVVPLNEGAALAGPSGWFEGA